MGTGTLKSRRGMDPSTDTWGVERMSERANLQQGLVTTCKDQSYNGKSKEKGGDWSDA